MTGEELVDLRNSFGLWEGNYELLISCGVRNEAREFRIDRIPEIEQV